MGHELTEASRVVSRLVYSDSDVAIVVQSHLSTSVSMLSAGILNL
jgi:hypothetical protein